MQTETPFIDFYATLEIEYTSEPAEIESQFFELGQRLHPDVPVTGDAEKFEELTLAFQVLRDPKSREQYDQVYLNEKAEDSFDSAKIDCSDAELENMDLAKEANDRIEIMRKFYERRRIDHKNSGLASGSLDGVVNCSPAMIEFHLWYCLAKGWLFREEGGQLSITATGADYIETGFLESQ